MRVWDIHPGYLSRNSLLGQHAEIHALFSVIKDCRKGYGSHPETLRWKGQLGKLKCRHDLTVKEMELRGYRHASPLLLEIIPEDSKESLSYVDHPSHQFEILREKYLESSLAGRIPLPVRGTDFWAHYKYSVMARGYNYYKEIQSSLKGKKDFPINQERAMIDQVLRIMEEPVNQKALKNLSNHLWGYFKKVASDEEKEKYVHCPPGKMPELIYFFYTMAVKYDQKYLLQSTVFADLLEMYTS